MDEICAPRVGRLLLLLKELEELEERGVQWEEREGEGGERFRLGGLFSFSAPGQLLFFFFFSQGSPLRSPGKPSTEERNLDLDLEQRSPQREGGGGGGGGGVSIQEGCCVVSEGGGGGRRVQLSATTSVHITGAHRTFLLEVVGVTPCTEEREKKKKKKPKYALTFFRKKVRHGSSSSDAQFHLYLPF